MNLKDLAKRVSAARAATEARGETFYPGPSRIHLAAFPPKERWDDWVELDSKAWPQRSERRFVLVPTTCFNCESACGLLAYIDRETLEVQKFEGNPEHPGSRGRNCAKGPATLNQVTDPDRILYPLRRVGARGEGKWERVEWEVALADVASRIRAAIVAKRPEAIMYHVGRPGEDGFTERIVANWGVDGHNSHTNICSAAARAGYAWWSGIDRPSPDHANAKVILLISSHLEAGHYFNPHAQRIMEGKQRGAKLIVFDTRLSNTATHADVWAAPVPGSEAAVLLAVANHLITHDLYNRAFVERWWNWQEYLADLHPDLSQTFDSFREVLKTLYAEYTFEFASAESGLEVSMIETIAQLVSTAGTALASHTWRSATAGNLGGWQVARTLFFLNALLGAVATEGGTYPNAWNKFVPKPIHMPKHPDHWNDLNWPGEFPLAMYEMSFLLPHLLKDRRGKLDVYFTRVYNPIWTNPDGFSWIEALSDESMVGLHVALTPTWNETAYFADYILPMGHGPERHDIHSYETHDSQWLAFRQPVRRAARARLGLELQDTRTVNPGEVWEENDFWLELTWRIDPDGSLGIRPFAESKQQPGERLSVDEYYQYIFENSVPGLPERSGAEGLSPIDYMRRYGSFEISRSLGAIYEREVPESQLVDVADGARGRVYTKAPAPPAINLVPTGMPEPDAAGRRAVGVRIDGTVRSGFPTPSGRLEFYSSTLARWGWPEHALPTYIRSHVHPEALGPDRFCLISTFRLPVHIHTRSANAKWLDEIAHSNPVWIHPRDAARMGVVTGDLVRVESEIGYLVNKAWVTEGIRPGVVACSHHMGRWKLAAGSQRQMMATVSLDHAREGWTMRREHNVVPFESSDPDTSRLWWNDAGVHQNLIFPVQPDPISGMHCWHQAVKVRKALDGDRYGDIMVDTEASHRAFQRWLEITRPALEHSPDGTRRPYWLIRPLRPSRQAYKLPTTGPAPPAG
jgi:anaerobic selenocysteine-containing dehydrogenase